MVASTNGNQNTTSAPSRRELLNYAFGASIALALAGSCGGLVWFTQKQRIGFGEKSGLFLVEMSNVPSQGGEPFHLREVGVWLAHVDGGLVAFYALCPFLRQRCLLKWSYTNQRFECPCCGSKFELDGTYIEGPAKRGMDRFIVRVTTQFGTQTTPDDGSPVSTEGAVSVIVDTDASTLISGKPRPFRPIGVRS